MIGFWVRVRVRVRIRVRLGLGLRFNVSVYNWSQSWTNVIHSHAHVKIGFYFQLLGVFMCSLQACCTRAILYCSRGGLECSFQKQSELYPCQTGLDACHGGPLPDRMCESELVPYLNKWVPECKPVLSPMGKQRVFHPVVRCKALAYRMRSSEIRFGTVCIVEQHGTARNSFASKSVWTQPKIQLFASIDQSNTRSRIKLL